MAIRGLLFVVILGLGTPLVSPGSASTQAVAGTGSLHPTFTERSLLSVLDVVLQQMDFNRQSICDWGEGCKRRPSEVTPNESTDHEENDCV